MAAELGEGTDKAFEALEAALKKQPKDADLHYDAARAFSLASQAVARTDKAKGRRLRSEPSACSGRRSRTTTPISANG